MSESQIYDLANKNWVKNPSQECVEAIFLNARLNGHSSIDDIIIKWSDTESNNWKDIHIAIMRNEDSCFVYKITKDTGIYESLVWDELKSNKKNITISDHGGADCHFFEYHRTPISDAFAFANEFINSGNTTNFPWDTEPLL